MASARRVARRVDGRVGRPRALLPRDRVAVEVVLGLGVARVEAEAAQFGGDAGGTRVELLLQLAHVVVRVEGGRVDAVVVLNGRSGRVEDEEGDSQEDQGAHHPETRPQGELATAYALDEAEGDEADREVHRCSCSGHPDGMVLVVNARHLNYGR